MVVCRRVRKNTRFATEDVDGHIYWYLHIAMTLHDGNRTKWGFLGPNIFGSLKIFKNTDSLL